VSFRGPIIAGTLFAFLLLGLAPAVVRLLRRYKLLDS
jgi:hypothetical protein